VVSRNDPDRSAAARAQLDALERILAREAVGEEHLELAALVESVRADAPRMAPAFAHQLDARIAARLAGRHRTAIGRGRLGRLALAGGGLVAAAVAFTIVISSGVLESRRNPSGGNAAGNTPALRRPAAARPTAPTSAGPVASTHGTPFGAKHGQASAPTVNAQATARSKAGAGLVHRASMLELAATATGLPHVADRVVALTEREGGVVASSFVNADGAASRASFSLRVPSGRLAALLAGLSALAQVRSLTQDTTDVSSGYGHVRAALGARRAERAQLSRRLRSAQTSAQRTALQRRIAALDALIARDVREASAYLGQAHTAALHVDVVVGATPKGAARGGAGGGPLDRASRTALYALEELLALALVALAIALPLAVGALVLWWGAATVRHRARDRAIRAA
jgi:Domain of unknown function (DUF4349)